jgi:hypothetical protein
MTNTPVSIDPLVSEKIAIAKSKIIADDQTDLAQLIREIGFHAGEDLFLFAIEHTTSLTMIGLVGDYYHSRTRISQINDLLKRKKTITPAVAHMIYSLYGWRYTPNNLGGFDTNMFCRQINLLLDTGNENIELDISDPDEVWKVVREAGNTHGLDPIRFFHTKNEYDHNEKRTSPSYRMHPNDAVVLEYNGYDHNNDNICTYNGTGRKVLRPHLNSQFQTMVKQCKDMLAMGPRLTPKTAEYLYRTIAYLNDSNMHQYTLPMYFTMEQIPELCMFANMLITHEILTYDMPTTQSSWHKLLTYPQNGKDNRFSGEGRTIFFVIKALLAYGTTESLDKITSRCILGLDPKFTIDQLMMLNVDPKLAALLLYLKPRNQPNVNLDSLHYFYTMGPQFTKYFNALTSVKMSGCRGPYAFPQWSKSDQLVNPVCEFNMLELLQSDNWEGLLSVLFQINDAGMVQVDKSGSPSDKSGSPSDKSGSPSDEYESEQVHKRKRGDESQVNQPISELEYAFTGWYGDGMELLINENRVIFNGTPLALQFSDESKRHVLMCLYRLVFFAIKNNRVRTAYEQLRVKRLLDELNDSLTYRRGVLGWLERLPVPPFDTTELKKLFSSTLRVMTEMPGFLLVRLRDLARLLDMPEYVTYIDTFKSNVWFPNKNSIYYQPANVVVPNAFNNVSISVAGAATTEVRSAATTETASAATTEAASVASTETASVAATEVTTN